MLDSETKRRIDTARDILVGKVPDPKSQVEQITIALIYKFMDDMDAQSEEFGGKRTFFAGEFERYGWAKLMRSGLGGFEMLNMYAEAIAKMPENPGIPLLFRNIFKNAYLPYRDPETLRAFLKIIDDFSYDHSERLGDAFEYLLSVLGSQGDAGQFRTPRHIIDFMVAVLDPKKTETVLDPACGTAGFLISSYKHILVANKDSKGNTNLTPDERERLVRNFRGYDISPDMVRLSLVNLYLHGFVDPNIAEYDTLTSQDKWNEYADVILANPPFMTPKGGIRPHKRFSVQSNRSEVLFVDYMAEHLTPTGRAGIIVPEGIIFQSQNAYKQLRKMLVEDFLVAVVSLPAGMFNPYSGVKTSILILDKSLAKRASTIAFFKIEKDGYGLGAQRRALCNCNGDKPELCPEHSDIPRSHREISEYLRRLRTGESIADFQPTNGLVVAKEKVAAKGDYNLGVDRYRDGIVTNSIFSFVALRDVSMLITKGTTPSTAGFSFEESGINFIKIESVSSEGKIISSKLSHISPSAHASLLRSQLEADDVVFSIAGAMGRSAVVDASILPANTNQALAIIRLKKDLILPVYLSYLLRSKRVLAHAELIKVGVAQFNLSLQQVGDIEIPLPPLEVQKEIVAEIEGYQKVIDGARQVVENYRPSIPVDPDWPIVELQEVCDVRDGTHDSPQYVDEGYPLITSKNLKNGYIEFSDVNLISRADLDAINKRSKVDAGDILMPMIGTIGNPVIADDSREYAVKNVALIKFYKNSPVENRFLKYVLASSEMQSLFDLQANGATQKFISLGYIRSLRIPLPAYALQLSIANEIESEQALVTGNKDLIARFEKKIQAVLARVWGEKSV